MWEDLGEPGSTCTAGPQPTGKVPAQQLIVGQLTAVKVGGGGGGGGSGQSGQSFTSLHGLVVEPRYRLVFNCILYILFQYECGVPVYRPILPVGLWDFYETIFRVAIINTSTLLPW